MAWECPVCGAEPIDGIARCPNSYCPRCGQLDSAVVVDMRDNLSVASGDAEIVANRVPGPEGESLSPVQATQEYQLDEELALSLDEYNVRYRLPWQRAAQDDLDREMTRIIEAMASSPNLVNP